MGFSVHIRGICCVFALVLCAISTCVHAEGSIPELSATSFPLAVSSSAPVLIEFKAKWCPYCKKEQADIERLRYALSGRMQVFQVDVDDEQDIAADFDAHVLPTLIIIYQGNVVGRTEGALYGDELRDWVEDTLKQSVHPADDSPASQSL